MELEEMRSLWQTMSAEVEKQKKSTAAIILSMTRMRFRNKLSKIILPEVISSLSCFGFVLFILLNLQKLNTWYLLVCGVVSAIILFILPVFSIRAVYRMNAVNLYANNYQQTLSAFAKAQLGFVWMQKLSFYLGAVLMLTVMPVMVMLMGGKDPFKRSGLWLIYVIIYPFFYWFAKWVFKKYLKITADAENILKELAG